MNKDQDSNQTNPNLLDNPTVTLFEACPVDEYSKVPNSQEKKETSKEAVEEAKIAILVDEV